MIVGIEFGTLVKIFVYGMITGATLLAAAEIFVFRKFRKKKVDKAD
jgi:hypothetical protein